MVLQVDRLDDGFIAQRLELDLEIALGQVLQEVVAGVVGRRADGRADDDHVDKSQVLFGFLIQDMPDQIGVGAVQGLFVRLDQQRLINKIIILFIICF